MLPAGKRDQVVAFQQAMRVPNSLGVMEDESWATVFTRFASVRWGTSQERRDAAAENALQTATFRTLRDSGTVTITALDRIEFDGLAWDITGIAPIDRAEIEFTATASRG